MKAGFLSDNKLFFRTKCFIVSAVVAASASCFAAFYADALKKSEIVDLTKTYYFLVSDSDSVAAAATEVFFGGGAGCVIVRQKTEYAVIACYLDASAARTVRDRLANRDVASSVLAESGGKLYLTSKREKASAAALSGFFTTMDECIRVLYMLAENADSGKYTQRNLKTALLDVSAVMKGLSGQKGGVLAPLSAEAAKFSEEIARISRQTIYAKEIRRVQAELADAYLSLAAQFSL